MLFDAAWRRIEENRQRKINVIPFGLPRFEEYLPGIQQKQYYIITANSGVGKSQVTDFLFLYQAYDYYLTNKKDLDLKIFYFSLEMDKESKIIAGMSKHLYQKYKIRTEVNQLLSASKHRLPDYVFKAIYKTREYFERMSDIVTIIDDQMTPTHINNIINKYAEKNGKIIKKVEDNVEVFDRYIPSNPNKFSIFITDHLAELTLDRDPILQRGLSLKETIEKHSDNNRINRNKYGFTFVDVQQQSAAKEDLEFFQGLSIVTKLEPSLQGLGESKLTQRKANVVLGLFAPNRYELPKYRGYDVTLLNDNFRSLSILKNRNGSANIHTGLYFDGATNYFEELPRSLEMTPEIYEDYRRKTIRT